MLSRMGVVKLGLAVLGLVILGRLFYWQVIQSNILAAEAENQRTSSEIISASRGSILSKDGYVLTANQDYYQLFAYKPQLEITIDQVSQQVAPLILAEPRDATEAAIPYPLRLQTFQSQLLSKLSDPDKKWVPLRRGLTQKQKEAVESLEILGLGFDVYQRRHYPEASMSAHLLGFVGHDEFGSPKGYFGLEGEYNLELQGKRGKVVQEKDATGKPILIGLFDQYQSREGRDLVLHLDRSVQHLAETQLREGMQKYGAKSGEVIIMHPQSGGVIASVALPSYDPVDLGEYDQSLYKNPLIANSYEPGSTFKVLVMAAGIEEGVITPKTVCGAACAKPVAIGKYTIRTWNSQYDPNQTMTEVLANSDNTGMVLVAQRLGKERFVDYIKAFGFGQLTGVDLQEEATPFLRQNWGDIDQATASFGQGIAVSGLQMVRATSVIANGGKLMQPQVVDKVIDGNRELDIEPKVVSQVISEATARTVTEMMVEAAHHGEAQWAVLNEYDVAGKTGTAQIPIDGHYDAEKTIASFVGFAPARDPKFVMLVKLREPESSPWAAETAAPLWYNIARDLLLYYNVPPTK